MVNVISEHFIEAANYTSIDAPSDVDEWALSGLTPVASSWTEGPAPPRVKESLYALECELYDVVHFHSDRDPGHVTANLVLGRVTAFMIQKGMFPSPFFCSPSVPFGLPAGLPLVQSS